VDITSGSCAASRQARAIAFAVAGDLLADPAGRSLPEGPFGPSEVIDPDGVSRGPTRPGAEVPPAKHVTLRDARRHVHAGGHVGRGGDLACRFFADLGVTTIEMMPINAFAGRYNWATTV